jgi:high affinity sulfate transporter 1
MSSMNSMNSIWLRRIAPGLETLIHYRKENFRFDIVSGLSVAAVALPVGIAYAEIAGVPSVIGIYSAIFPLFAYALFGSSRQLMTGPDAATCIMAASSIGAIAGGDPQRYLLLMVALTLITGLFYIGAGLAKLGFIADYLSLPILVGYLHGVGLIILIGQLPKLLGYLPEGDGFIRQVATFFENLPKTNQPSLILGGSLLLLLFLIRRFLPKLPAPLVVAAAGIVFVMIFGLKDKGVSVLGTVPSGFPPFHFPVLNLKELVAIIRDAAGVTLISFTSGVLTSKSFARRNGYPIDPNQEMIGFGAANLASGLAQGFPVTGADSRTAVNTATGGRTQLAGIVAGLTMLAFLLFLTNALSMLPKTALAAIIIVSALGFFDFKALRELRNASWRELFFSLATTAGVLFFGVLPGVFIAVILSIIWLLIAESKPHDAVLGKAPDVKGFHDINDYPEAQTIPGLLIYRFDANLVFFNCDHFRQRVKQLIAESPTPVEWLVIDAGTINVVDFTATQAFRELRNDLTEKGIVVVTAALKQHLKLYFRKKWLKNMEIKNEYLSYPTVKSAVSAFKRRNSPQDIQGPEEMERTL